MNILLVTGNKNKLREAEQILGIKLNTVDVDLDELQELDPDKIAEHKALQAWELFKEPVVIWDQSLFISCLNDFPGPLVKWFWEQVGQEKICQIAKALGNNKISTKTTLTYYDGKKIKHFYGEKQGTIPSEPRGTNGFHWDTIFIMDGETKTNAELDPEYKNNIFSHKIALEKLRDYLKENRVD